MGKENKSSFNEDTNFDSNKYTADDLNNRALSFIDLNKNKEAVKLWNTALLTEDSHYASNINLALYEWNYQITNPNKKELIKKINRGIAARPNDPEVYYFKALLHFKMKEFEECDKIITIAINKGLDDAKVYNIKGLCLLTLQKNNEAAEYLRKAIAKNTDNYGYISNLANAFHQAGEYKAEIECEEKLKQLHKKQYIEAQKQKEYSFWNIEIPDTSLRNNAHDDKITSLSINYDGTKAISTDKSGTMFIHDFEQMELVHSICAHKTSILTSAISANGKTIITGGNDKLVKVWDSESGKCIFTFLEHQKYIYNVVINAKGTLAVSSSGDETIKIWDLEKGKCIHTIQHSHWYIKLAINAFGDKLITGCTIQNKFQLWDTVTGKCIETYEIPDGTIESIAFTSDGNKVLISANRKIRLWDLKTGKYTGKLDFESKYIFMDAHARIAVGSSGITIWDLENNKCLKTYPFSNHKIPSSALNKFALSGDGKKLLTTASWDKALRLWKIKYIKDFKHSIYYDENEYLLVKVKSLADDIKIQKQFKNLVKEANRLFKDENFSESYQKVQQATSISGFRTNYQTDEISNKLYQKAKLDKLKKASLIKVFKAGNQEIESIKMDLSGKIGIGGCKDSNITIWDLISGLQKITFKEHNAPVVTVDIDSNGKNAISGSYDKTIKIWDLENNKCLKTFTEHKSRISFVTISQDGTLAVSGDEEAYLKVWNLNTYQCLTTFTEHTNKINSLQLSKNKDKLYSSSDDKTIKIWDLKNNKLIKSLEEKDRRVVTYRADADSNVEEYQSSMECISLNSNETKILNCSDSKTIRIWNLNEYKIIKNLHKPWVSVVEAHWCPNRNIMIECNENQFKIRNMDDYSIMASFSNNTRIKSFSISNDCRKILTNNFDGTSNLWELEWELNFEHQKNNIKKDEDHFKPTSETSQSHNELIKKQIPKINSLNNQKYSNFPLVTCTICGKSFAALPDDIKDVKPPLYLIISYLAIIVTSILLPVFLSIWWLIFTFTIGIFASYELYYYLLFIFGKRIIIKCPHCNKKFIHKKLIFN